MEAARTEKAALRAALRADLKLEAELKASLLTVQSELKVKEELWQEQVTPPQDALAPLTLSSSHTVFLPWEPLTGGYPLSGSGKGCRGL